MCPIVNIRTPSCRIRQRESARAGEKRPTGFGSTGVLRNLLARRLDLTVNTEFMDDFAVVEGLEIIRRRSASDKFQHSYVRSEQMEGSLVG